MEHVFNKMLKWLGFLSVFLAPMVLYAEEIDVSQPLRIEALLPKRRMYSLGIEPALPKHFVVLSPGLEPDASNFYWGRKEVLDAFFKNQDSLSEPIIRVSITTGIVQRKFGELNEKKIRDEVAEGEKSGKIKNAILHFGHWGDYPYCTLRSTIENQELDMAYVGLNHESGTILLFDLLLSENPKPEMRKQGSKLWNTFFQDTKELPEPLLYKALGQELHTGYTLVKILNHKIKMIAERRKSDQRIRCAFMPQDAPVVFKFESAFVNFKGDKWRIGDPMLKIKGAYNLEKDGVLLFQTTSVFIREVDEFTQVNTLKKNVFVKEL